MEHFGAVQIILTVNDKPQRDKPQTEKPISEKPQTEKPISSNPPPWKAKSK
jgi:hypothetical protein